MFNQISRTSTYKFLLGLLICLLCLPVPSPGQEAATVDFEKTIKPIFEQHCLRCHGEKEPKNFRIDIAEDEAMNYVVPESADESDLYLSLISDDDEVLMPPPAEENPLTESQIQSVKDWIDQGAVWPTGVQFELPAGTQFLVDEPTNVAPTQNDGTANVDAEETSQDQIPAAAPVVDRKTQRLFDATGSLHPAAVHLPIGLLLAAGLFALLSLRGNFVMSDCAYYCLWLGTLGAIVACATGWWASPLAGKGTVHVVNDLWDQSQPVFWHRTSAVIATVFAFLLALFAASARNRDPDDGVVWKMGLILLAIGIGWVGHLGGKLTHGKHHYDAIQGIAEDLLPSVFKPADKGPQDVIQDRSAVEETKSDNAPTTPEDEVGRTSDET